MEKDRHSRKLNAKHGSQLERLPQNKEKTKGKDEISDEIEGALDAQKDLVDRE